MREAYQEILAVLEKHKDVISGDHSTDIRCRIRELIKWSYILEDFGITISPSKIYGDDWIEISYNQCIGLYGKDIKRTISYPDDGRQPEGEWLYLVKFPNGAYTYGDSYPTKTFGAMIEEVKSYGPKYIDSTNKRFYFDSDSAKFIHNDLSAIIEKHRASVEAEIKDQKKAELQRQLAELED